MLFKAMVCLSSVQSWDEQVLVEPENVSAIEQPRLECLDMVNTVQPCTKGSAVLFGQYHLDSRHTILDL